MRDLSSAEMELVGGGLIDISTGDINILNGISALNDNEIASGNSVTVSGNANGNASGNSVSATVNALIDGLGL